jgi:hypothetical protein
VRVLEGAELCLVFQVFVCHHDSVTFWEFVAIPQAQVVPSKSWQTGERTMVIHSRKISLTLTVFLLTLSGSYNAANALLSPTGPATKQGFPPGTNRMTVFGGFHGGINEGAFNDVWVLTNANGLNDTPQWIQLLPAGAGPNRAEHTTIYDSATNRMTIFGVV